MTEQTFSEWFDPNNVEHIEAYSHLRKTGFWPKGFGEHCAKGQHWQVEIVNKMTDAWVAFIITNKSLNRTHRVELT